MLEFSITDGGTILWEQRDGRDRRLRVQTKYGNTVEITRQYRGGLCVCELNFFHLQSNMTRFVQLKNFVFILKDTIQTLGDSGQGNRKADTTIKFQGKGNLII